MALALKKDVQKASYYVFFLGAQEAKELRGERVLLSTLPHLIERSRQQEPLKVTLQISHKGIKIIQGSAKHFIPHNAITCSIVSDDVVACVLLLYNPETRCPLHVHCYRCDSESTAQALNEQLQSLIKKPENQKKFAELEVKLQKTRPVVNMPIKSVSNMKADIIQRRFESSLGSDAGTSRESECSEEIQPIDERNLHLFDSLAAELKEKLNGGVNGPPLLLPPRDYDTISRAQGNLTAVELRRCKNTSIVGQVKEVVSQKKSKASSHGSSGIGSDELAPSPELHRDQDLSNGSSDDWRNEISNVTKKMERTNISSSNIKDKHFREMKYREKTPPTNNNYINSNSNFNNHMKSGKKTVEKYGNGNKYHLDEKQFSEDRVSGLMRQQSERYRHAVERMSYEKDKYYKNDNYLLDRKNNSSQNNTTTYEVKTKFHNNSSSAGYNRYSEKTNDRYHEMNPYKEAESLPYQQSNDMFCRGFHRKSTNGSRVREQSPVLSTMKRTSPKDRFINAKEKFQAIDKRRYDDEEFPRRNDAYQRKIRQSFSPKRHQNYNEISSDEDYREPQVTKLIPAKSLGNLASRSRHSYAEPMNFFNCNRVGLARIT